MEDPIRIRACPAVAEDDRLWLVPLCDTDAGRVHWSLPGGRLHFGESLQACAVRKFEEEAALRAEVLGLLDVSEVVLPEKPYHSVTIASSGRVVAGQVRPESQHRHGAKAPRRFASQQVAGLECHLRSVVLHALGLR
jgi:8-oxo-dGTP diphosphatase